MAVLICYLVAFILLVKTIRIVRAERADLSDWILLRRLGSSKIVPFLSGAFILLLASIWVGDIPASSWVWIDYCALCAGVVAIMLAWAISIYEDIKDASYLSAVFQIGFWLISGAFLAFLLLMLRLSVAEPLVAELKTKEVCYQATTQTTKPLIKLCAR